MPDAPAPSPASAPAAPSPAAAKAPTPAPEPKPSINNPFADLDALFNEPEPDNPAPAKPSAKPDKPDAKQDKPGAKPGDKPANVDTGAAKPELNGPKQLRTAYENATKRLKELEAEREKWVKPADDPEKKTLAERLEAVEKRRQEIEEELKYAAYERSQEYKDKYQSPLENALKSAYQDVAQLTITDENGNETKGTDAHMQALLRMDLPAAITKAKEWFGDTAASEVLAMRRNIMDLYSRSQQAIEQFRKDGSERERQRAEMTTKQREAESKAFKQYVQEGIESRPDLFKPADDDAKGKELITKGFAMADAAFGAVKIPDQERPKLHAAIRNKAGGYDYLAYRYREANRRIKELETRLSEYESSEPAEGKGARTPKSEPMTWEQEIDALASS